MWSPNGPPLATPADREGWSVDGPPPIPATPRLGWVNSPGRYGVDTGAAGDLGVGVAALLGLSTATGVDAGMAAVGSLLLVDTPAVSEHGLVLGAAVGVESAVGRDWGAVGLRGVDAVHSADSGLVLPGARGRTVSTASDAGVVAGAASGRDRAAAGDHGSGGWVWQAPQALSFTTPGSHTVQIPVSPTFIEIVLLGGGASGQTGSGVAFGAGRGGNPGQWFSTTLVRGVDVPWGLASFTIVVGNGGPRAANSDYAPPQPGEATTATAAGVGTLSAPGGSGTKTVQGTNWQVGAPAGNHTHEGVTYTGGGESNSSTPQGRPPGGGGAGGDGGIFGNRTRGWEGAVGGAWVRFQW